MGVTVVELESRAKSTELVVASAADGIDCGGSVALIATSDSEMRDRLRALE